MELRCLTLVDLGPMTIREILLGLLLFRQLQFFQAT